MQQGDLAALVHLSSDIRRERHERTHGMHHQRAMLRDRTAAKPSSFLLYELRSFRRHPGERITERELIFEDGPGRVRL